MVKLKHELTPVVCAEEDFSLEDEVLFDIIEQYFKKNNVGPRKWNYFGFYANEFIPSKILKNAKRVYASYDDNEEIPLLLIDDAVLFNGKRGVLITDSSIYYRLFPADLKGSNIIGQIKLEDVKEITLSKFMDRAWVTINNRKVGMLVGIGGPPKGRIDVLNKYFSYLLQAIHCKD